MDLTSADKERILQSYFNGRENNPTTFKIVSFKVAPFGPQRTGYLGDHFLLTFTVLLDGEDSSNNLGLIQEVTLFAKTLPRGIPSLARYLQETKVFYKEAELCGELLPRLSELGRFAPEALFTKDHEVIVFRNAKVEGFRTLEHNDGLLDLAHLEQALRVLARMHAASLALEAKCGKSLGEVFPGVLEENAWVKRENYPRVKELEDDIEMFCALIKHYEKSGKRRENLVGRVPTCVRQIYELVKPSEVTRNVFSHGDLWSNNLMFRYSENGTPVDCLLVDFQLARYVPPAYDFSMLVTLTTTSGFRRKHMSFLQGYYYQSLRMELSRHQLRVEQIMSQEEFRESCQFYRKAGAIDSFIINHVTLLPKDILDGIFASAENYEQFSGETKITKCLKVFDDNLSYRTRMVDIIENFFEVFRLE